MQSMGNELASSTASGLGGGAGGFDWKGLVGGVSPLLAPLLGNLFGDKWKNPAKAGMPYLENVPEQLKPYFDPYVKAGQGALPSLQQQYGNLLGNPGNVLNQIGQGYQKSPGYDFELKQALGAAGRAAAAGGLAGSPSHEFQNMEIAQGLANKDYNNWLSNALGLYGQGLAGQQGLYQTGYGASTGLGESLAQNELSKALMQYMGQGMQNEHDTKKSGSIWGTLGDIAMKALPFFL